MSQIRFIKYKDPINSLPLNEKFVGIITPSLYCGFDNIIDGNNLTFKLDHETTGELFTNQNLSVTPRRGAWVSKQGIVIKEDEPIPIVLDTNFGNNSIRYDLLVGRHNHDVIYPGGVAASYEIIKGPLNNATQPAVQTPETDVILGVFEIAPQGESFNNVKFKRDYTLGLGGKKNSRINELNRFIAQQQFYQRSDVINVVDNTFTGVNKRVLSGLSGGNSFVVDGGGNLDFIEDLPEGTELNIMFILETTIKSFTKQLSGGASGLGERFLYQFGLRAINIGEDYTNDLVIKAGETIKILKTNSTLNFVTNTQPIWGDYWKLISVSTSPLRVSLLEKALVLSNQAIVDLNTKVNGLVLNRPYQILEVFLPDPSEHFVIIGPNDTWGLGKDDSIWKGTAICNGNNGTPDKRRQFFSGYDRDNNEYNQVGGLGGRQNNTVTLNITNMPPHDHDYNAARANGSASGNANTHPDGPMTIRRTGLTGGQSGVAQPFDIRPSYQVALYVMVLPA